MAKKMTHTGITKGCDNRTRKGAASKIKLRGTKLYWVTERGTKYRKDNGWMAGTDWPTWSLDISTIEEIKEA